MCQMLRSILNRAKSPLSQFQEWLNSILPKAHQTVTIMSGNRFTKEGDGSRRPWPWSEYRWELPIAIKIQGLDNDGLRVERKELGEETAIVSLSISNSSGGGVVLVSNQVIGAINIGGFCSEKIVFQNCWIRQLVIGENGRDSTCFVTIKECIIASLLLKPEGCSDLIIDDCLLLSVAAPVSREKNPVKRSLVIKNCKLPERDSTPELAGLQGLRNLRLHAAAMQNVDAASKLHAAELRIERRLQEPAAAIANWCYEKISLYGYSIGRPLLALAASFVLFGVCFALLGGPEVNKTYSLAMNSWLIEKGCLATLQR